MQPLSGGGGKERLVAVVLASNHLYDRDILTWSDYQADLLRRLARRAVTGLN